MLKGANLMGLRQLGGWETSWRLRDSVLTEVQPINIVMLSPPWFNC
jgi:hypothetical protein